MATFNFREKREVKLMNEGRQNVVVVQREDSNGLGLAGFVLSLLGLVSCGLFGPLGFLVSLFGLAYRPRGFAVAGLVLGGLTTGIFALFGFAFLSMLFAMITGIQLVATEASNAKQMVTANIEIRDHFTEHDSLPSTEEGNDLINAEREEDAPFSGYERVDEFRYKITVAGLDGELGTEDDRTYDFDIREDARDVAMPETLDEHDEAATAPEPNNEPMPVIEKDDPSSQDMLEEPKPTTSPPPSVTPYRTSSQPIETDLSEAPTIEEATRTGVFNPDQMDNSIPPVLTGVITFETEIERSWQSLDGKFTTTATLLKFDRDKEEVVLRKSDGVEITVPIKTLSYDDRNYVRDQARATE
ncbi:SHD1 domain-containing protein [Bremerella sp. JC770]|uniref:SHD1 domain-containing protein n=1 Tax=Bremerella sp. JC770 TaxID=3232137 RepID=UPI00345817C4